MEATREIVPVSGTDLPAYRRMRVHLWPHLTAKENEQETAAILAAADQCVLLARVNGVPVGFLEVGLRSHGEGCTTSPIGYLEGWWVEPPYRLRRIGGDLVRAAEEWARARGCREMGSDTEIHNRISQEAHERLGYDEVDRIVCYRKNL